MLKTTVLDSLTSQLAAVQHSMFCKRFEPRNHYKSRLSLIVRVNVVLNRTVVVDVSTTCAVVIFRVKVSCITSVDGIILWLLN